MSQPAAKPRVLQFGLFELDLDSRELRKSGIRITLQEQPFLILEMLLDRPRAIVTRNELKKKLWPGDTFVDFDLSLNSAVKKLRQALNDNPEKPRYIETLYRRGYGFIGPVNETADERQTQLDSCAPGSILSVESAPAPPTARITSRPISTRRLALYAAGGPLFLLLSAALWLIPSRGQRVLGYTQITRDGLGKGEMLTDGQRLCIVELQGDHFTVAQVSVAGGETGVVPTPFENAFAVGCRFQWLVPACRNLPGHRQECRAFGLFLCPVEPPAALATWSPTLPSGRPMARSCSSHTGPRFSKRRMMAASCTSWPR